MCGANLDFLEIIVGLDANLDFLVNDRKHSSLLKRVWVFKMALSSDSFMFCLVCSMNVTIEEY